MTGSRARLLRILVACAACVLLCARTVAAGPDPQALQGRLLADALRVLQRSGLNIVFSTELVTRDMRVVREPRAPTSRARLDEMLEPHGLKAEDGPGSIVQVVRDPRARVRSAAAKPPRQAESRGSADHTAVVVPPTYTERVDVGPRPSHVKPGALSATSMDFGGQSLTTRDVGDDPLQAIRSMPRVTAVDDFRSEFSVRGSPYRHVGLVIDGVATPWLRHTIYGRDVGSLSMFGLDAVERATLQVGAYPRRYGDRLGGELELTLREGSREARRARASLGGLSAAALVEGPLGRSGRGSWLLGARHSYLGWPVPQATPSGATFGFADAQAKLAYDISPGQQIALSVVAGRSMVDEPDDAHALALTAGTNEAALVSLAWRSALTPRTLLVQRASVVAHEFDSRSASQDSAHGSNRLLAYRAAVVQDVHGTVLEAGGEVQQMHGARRLPLTGSFAATWTTLAAFAHVERAMGRGLTVGAGLRVADSTLAGEPAWSRWASADWTVAPRWTVSAAAGVSHQFPDLEHVRGFAGSPDLRAERARHVDLGIEHRWSDSIRWQATLFNRDEQDVLREPEFGGRFDNALDGRSRGVEFLVAHEGAARLSGRASYAYGFSRHWDPGTGETSRAAFDRPHAFTASGAYRLSDRTSVGINFRAASNVPMPGRNAMRLPPYARLDVRAQRTMSSWGRRVTVFVEVLNVLGRENYAPVQGVIWRGTGDTTGLTRTLTPRRPWAGLVIEF